MTAPRDAGGATAYGRPREAFLETPRAGLICSRQFDLLSDEIATLVGERSTLADGLAPELRRAPGRCIVQLGPVALTVSWVHARIDTVANGRLMIIEWLGTVGRGARRSPERQKTAIDVASARTIRETILIAEATSEQDWHWCSEQPPLVRYHTSGLAQFCVTSLWDSLGGAIPARA